MSRDTDIAWAAGLFEGEGTWGYQPNCVRAELSMVDADTVARFHAIVGVGRIEPRPHRVAHWQPQVQWRVTDRAGVEHVLALFRPWLSPRRLARGEEVLRLQAERSAAIAQARDMACKNGHPRNYENTEWVTRKDRPPYRRCRVCLREANRRQRGKQQLAASLESVLKREEGES